MTPQETARRSRAWLLLLGFVLLCALAPVPARAAAFEVADTGWEGTSELLQLAREQLGKERVEIVATLDYSKLTPRDGVLVLHPTVDVDFEHASAFMRSGGRLALLDDHGRGGAFLERFQIKRIQSPLRPATSLRGNPSFAIALPSVRQVAGHETGLHPIVAEAKQLVTNHPTGLLHNNLTPVLEIQALGEPDVTLAVTGIIGNKGRLFAMGDPSAVMNLMLRYPGNRAFAAGLVRYLVEDDSWGPRQGKLYVVANRFKQTGAYGGGDQGLADELGDYLDGLKEALNDAHDEGLPELVAVLVAALLGLAAVGGMALLSSRAYRRLSPRYARPEPLVAQPGLAGRAAVLAAPTTHRALALMELKSALMDALTHRLGLDPSAATSTILQEIDRQAALSRRSSEQLRAMLEELSRAESAVMASQGMRVSASAVVAMQSRIAAILDEVEGSEPRGTAA